VYASDISPAMLAFARGKAAERGVSNVSFEPGGFLSGFTPPQQVGGVVSQLALHHLPDFWKQVALKRIALGLDKSYSEVAGVVSFYSFFSTTPRGKHLVRVCLGTACYVRGGKRVLDTLKSKLGIDVGETTPDRTFTLEVARCFGACGLAPAIMIDDDVHHRVKPNKMDVVLNKYRENGQVAAPARGRRS